MDFCAVQPLGKTVLLQVCAEVNEVETLEREVRALQAVAPLYPEATVLLITLDTIPPKINLPDTIHWRPAIQWLLDKSEE